MDSIIAAGVFRIIQAFLFPLGAAGYVPFVVKLIAYGRESGTSATVAASLYARYMLHRLGTRHDESAARMMRMMPNIPQLGLRLLTAPTLVAHAVTGHVPRIYCYPYPGEPPLMHQASSRTTFYDEVLERHLADVDQLVILGAGFDTRAYRLPAEEHVRCFEVDKPKTQAFKREMLKKAGVDTTRVTYVPADFEAEDWFEKLVGAGFDPHRPSLFTWESVMMYLDREAVEGTLRKMAGTAPGTIVALDYLSTEIIESRSPFMRYTRAVLKALGEPLKFGIDNTPPVRERVAGFLASCGLSLEEQRDFGPETDRRRALAGFAIAVVPVR